METTEQKRRRLYGKQYLPLYLKELGKILRNEVKYYSLLPITFTDKIREQNQAKQVKYSSTILFGDKEQLMNIILENISIYEQYYVYTSFSKDCGTVPISSLCEFNFDFSFKDVSSGVITLTRADLREEVVLDFYEESGTEFLNIKFLVNK